MKHIALDTNAYSRFKGGDVDVVELMRYADTINISTIVIGELLGGFALGVKEAINKQELNTFLNSSRCQIFPVDDNTAIYYVQIYKSLHRQGKPIPTNDLWIAAVAMQHGHILCTFDKHFNQIDGLLICTQVSDILP